MNAITFKGKKGCFKRSKDETASKKVMDLYSPKIDKVIEDALSQSFSSNFIDSFMLKLFNDETCFYESVRCAYLSTSTFQPRKFYKQLKSLLVERKEKKNIKFYDAQPALKELLGDVKKEANEFIGIFNVSGAFDKKFFKKSQKAVLIFVTMFNLGEESSLGFLGIPAYTSSIYDQKNFVHLVKEGLSKTPLYPSTVEEELDLYDKFHRSDRILTRRLKLHLVKFITSNKEAQICHLLKKLQYDLGESGKLENSLRKAAERLAPEDFIKLFEPFEECLHQIGEKNSDKIKACLVDFVKVGKENNEKQKEIYEDLIEIICDEVAPDMYESEKLNKGLRAIIKNEEEYPVSNVVDNMDEEGFEDYKLVHEMISDIAHEHRPILYHDVLERFSDVMHNSIPKYLQKFPTEYYFRVILDSLAYCGILITERKSDSPDLIKFFPTPSYNLIKKQIENCDME
uniref:Uncharacterized protein n=1 Tax=Panagrolaimus sp. ES5 TaxID=591445 RepID=A0AC34FNN3_9BILA